MRSRWLLLLLAACPVSAWAAPGAGYVYPAGGRQGTTFEATIGGQNLNGVDRVHVSGDGVRATVVWYLRPLNNLQSRELGIRLREARQQRWGAWARQGRAQPARPAAANPPGDRIELPDHPLLRDLAKQTPAQWDMLARVFLFRDPKKQPNAQIAEAVRLRFTVDPAATPGDRELRLGTPTGFTSPLRFQVSRQPELYEPGIFDVTPRLLTAQDLPVVLNGQVMPGEVDSFRLKARQGQRVVIRAHARSLTPYLADAVPGWFQAVVSLHDAKGREVAFADDYRFDPDPVLYYEIPADGEYELRIRDSIYRGRDDFVYRVSVGEQPFVTRVFPLGARAGAPAAVSIAGWNLPEKRLDLDTRPEGDRFRQAALRAGAGISNPVSYAVDALPERDEAEPNNTSREARACGLPVIVNGIIVRPGDVDRFRFEGRSGQEVVAEVCARRLGSPLDSLLRLSDASGKVLAWNDDHEDKGTGLLTHHADSYLRARLPKDGPYFVQLSDSQQHGGEAYAYRLRLGPPQPDFALRATPSTLNVTTTGVVPVTVFALRRDGFTGEIELALKDAPPGFRLSGGRIPAGRECVRMTVSAPRDRLDNPVALRLEGRARIGEELVFRPAVPADDMMQAFAYRHLVPAHELLVAAARFGRQTPGVELANNGTVRIPSGGTARVQVRAPWRFMLRSLRLELSDPPKGVTLQDVTVTGDGLTFSLKADAAAGPAGYADNLIVEAFTEQAAPAQGNRPAARGRRTPVGVLPAIPFEIVQR